VSVQLDSSSALPPGKGPPGTDWIGGRLDPRAGLDDMEKRKFLILPGLEFRPVDHSARSQSLHWMRYRDSWHGKYTVVYLIQSPVSYSKGVCDSAIIDAVSTRWNRIWNWTHNHSYFGSNTCALPFSINKKKNNRWTNYGPIREHCTEPMQIIIISSQMICYKCVWQGEIPR
jgi:hypothetical protein